RGGGEDRHQPERRPVTGRRSERRAARAALRDGRRPPARCPGRSRSRRARLVAGRRQARHADARGRLHPPDGKDAPVNAVAARQPVPAQRQVFLAVLGRDVSVTWSEFPVFLAQVILQPFFLLFVFGKVLGSLGYTTPGYSDLLFPGLLALT